MLTHGLNKIEEKNSFLKLNLVENNSRKNELETTKFRDLRTIWKQCSRNIGDDSIVSNYDKVI